MIFLLEMKPRLFNPKAVSGQGVLVGKKSKPHSFMGPLQSLQQGIAGAGLAPLGLKIGANREMGPERVWGWP